MAESRYIRNMELHLPEEEVEEEVRAFMENMGFYPTTWKEESCFGADYRPNGVQSGISGYQRIYFFKYQYENGILHTEAWVRDGKKKEAGLTGMALFMMKQPYLEQMVRLERRLMERLPEDSELRTKNQAAVEDMSKKNEKMDKGRQIVYVASVLLVILAFLGILRDMGFFQ